MITVDDTVFGPLTGTIYSSVVAGPANAADRRVARGRISLPIMGGVMTVEDVSTRTRSAAVHDRRQVSLQ
jgi:hypothetical protein